MKKLFFIALLLCGITYMGSCDYDDSNDLDVFTPNDSTDAKTNLRQLD